jgi:hypothetical protein
MCARPHQRGVTSDRVTSDRVTSDRVTSDRVTSDRVTSDRVTAAPKWCSSLPAASLRARFRFPAGFPEHPAWERSSNG